MKFVGTLPGIGEQSSAPGMNFIGDILPDKPANFTDPVYSMNKLGPFVIAGGMLSVDPGYYESLDQERRKEVNRIIEESNEHADPLQFAYDQVASTQQHAGWAERIADRIGTQLGGFLVKGKDIVTGDWEQLARDSEAKVRLQQAQSQAAKSWFEGIAGSAASSLSQVLYTAPAGGYGIIAGFVMDSATDAYAESRLAGQDHEAAIKYAAGIGVIEGAVSAAFQMVGLGGLEALGKQAMWQTAKQVGKQILAEVAEEEIVEFSQAGLSVAMEVDPQALDDPMKLGVDTAASTLLAVGGGHAVTHGPNVYSKFIDNASRRAAKEAGVDQVATNQKQRQKLATDAKRIYEHKQYAAGFREQLNAVVEAGRITPEQARYTEYLVAARARAAGETLGEYLQKRGVRVENAKWEDFRDTGNRAAIDQSQAQKQGPLRRNAEIDFTQEGEVVIRAFETANFGSMIHELGHLFRRDLAGPDLDAGAKWAGAKRYKSERTEQSPLAPDMGMRDGEWVWSRGAEEKFARGFEQYMTEGKAPTPKLKRLFEKVATWMKEVYSALRKSPVDVGMTPEMQQVYDRLFLEPETAVEATQQTVATETSPGTETPEGDAADILASERDLGPIGIKNAAVDKDRMERGLPPLMTRLRKSHQQAWDNAMRRINEQSNWQDKLVGEALAKPRPFTDEETMGLLHRQAELKLEAEGLYEQKLAADNQGDAETAGELQLQIDLLEEERQELERVARDVGSEQGRALAARKAMVNDDFTLATMMLDARKAKGEVLSPEESAKVAELQKKLDALQKKYDALRDKRNAEGEDNGLAKAMSKAKTRRKRGKLSPEQQRDAAVAAIMAKREKGQSIKSELDKLARLFWEAGIREQEPMIDALHGVVGPLIEGWTREDTSRAWSGYGDYKLLSKEEIDKGLRDLKGQTQQLLKIEAIVNRKPLEKTGVERREPSQKERDLIKQVNELKRQYGVVVTDPETQLKSSLDARKTYYRNRMADLRQEIETRQRTVPNKTKPPTDPELDKLIAEYRQLQQEHEEIFGRRELTDEQRLEMAIKSAERNLQTWQQRQKDAAKGKFDWETRRKRKYSSDELDAIRARTEEAKAAVEELRTLHDPKWRERIALKAIKTRMASQEAELRERLANKDFETQPRQSVELDAEAAKAKAQLDMVRKEWHEQRAQWRWDRLSLWEKAKKGVAPAYDMLRNFLTTGEFSFVLRQGKVEFLAHPVQSLRSIRSAFKALGDEETSLSLDNELALHPRYNEAAEAGVHFSHEDSALSNQEEFIMAKWVGEKAPRGLKTVTKFQHAFNRAGRVYMNQLRLNAYLRLVDAGRVESAEGKQAVANYVNVSTGRGNLGELEKHTLLLNRLLFSPKYLISRFQMLLAQPLWRGDKASRRVIAQEYLRAVAGYGVYYTLLATALAGMADDDDQHEIVTDPRSTDFLKIRIGDTRIDPLAGLQQVAVFITREARGEKVTGSGEVVDLRDPKYGGDDSRSVFWRFVEGKLHPALSKGIKVMAGRDLVGKPVTLTGEVANTFTPITYQDVIEAYQQHNIPEASAMTLLALFGEGVQVYAPTAPTE